MSESEASTDQESTEEYSSEDEGKDSNFTKLPLIEERGGEETEEEAEEEEDDEEEKEKEKKVVRKDNVDENANLAKNMKKPQPMPSNGMPIKSTTENQVVHLKEFAKFPLETENIIDSVKSSTKDPTKPTTATKHPTTEVMVKQALISLNEFNGSSVQAIKKYILNNYENINEKNIAKLIFKYLKKAVTEGLVIQKKKSYKIVKNKIVDKKVKKPRKAAVKKANGDNAEKAAIPKAATATVKLTGKSAKLMEPKVPNKGAKMALSADPLKQVAKPKSKTAKAEEPQTLANSAAVAEKTKTIPKTTRKLYNEKDSVISVKLPNKVTAKSSDTKANAKKAEPNIKNSEMPSTSQKVTQAKKTKASSEDSDVPSTSKRNAQAKKVEPPGGKASEKPSARQKTSQRAKTQKSKK